MFRNVAKYFRAKLRKWLGVVDAPSQLIVKSKQSENEGISIASALLAKAGEKVIHRPFGPPALPPGVVPFDVAPYALADNSGLGPYIALDSEFVMPTYAFANSYNSGLGFPGYAYLAELSQRPEYRAPAETISSEMTREWIKFTVKGKARKKDRKALGQDEELKNDPTSGLEDKLEEIEEAFEQFQVRAHFRKVAELDSFFGRAQLFIDIERNGIDQNELQQLPLVIDKATIPKGSLLGFKVIEPLWSTPYTYNANNPLSKDFYLPRAWFVMGRRVHATRLLTFIMREVPDMLKPSYNFGGISMSQLCETYVYQFLRTRNSISDLVHNFSVMVLATDMANVLSGKANSGPGLLQRAALFIANRDNQGLTLIDKDREEMKAVNVPLSGLDKLQSQAQEHMAAPTHIPLVKLIGVSPQGLNASSEGEIQVFYDFVKACQEAFYGAHLKTVLQIIQLHLFGSIDEAIGFEFVSLSSPSVKELAEIRKSNAETDATYIDKGVVSADEVRERVASDPESGYNNLTGPAPEPPDMTGMNVQHELGEQSAESAHERAKEMQATADKNKGEK